MDPATHEHHHHHEMPTEGSALTAVAFSATLHCLTGCAIGEVTGMFIGTALGFSDLGTVALAVALAFLFGYTLTSLPLLRAGLALGAVVPIALASDTISIGVMEIVDNAIMLSVPGAMEAGVGDLLFWGALAVALVIAGAVALPVNRWLIARGKGHVAVHNTGIHGGPPTRVVAVIAAVAAIFGTTVLVAEAMHGGDGGHGASAVRGLAASADGMTLSLDQRELEPGRQAELSFRIMEGDSVVEEFDVSHEKRMHLIVARRDLTGFQHLHPELGGDGTWRTPVTVPDGGEYRVFADFRRDGENQTLASDLTVTGEARARELPDSAPIATTSAGYQVELEGESVAGAESELTFTVSRDGAAVETEPYLGAGGHLVVLRESDLAYLHAHPTGDAGGSTIAFATEFPSEARYRLFVQFKHDGEVHTAAFTRVVDESAEGRGGHGGGH